MGKSEGKRPLGRPRRRWENNIKIISSISGVGDMQPVYLSQDSDMPHSCECVNEPLLFIKCGEFLDWFRTCSLLKKDSAPCS